MTVNARVNFNIDDNFENAAQLDAPPVGLDSAPDKGDDFEQESEEKEKKEIPKIPTYIYLEFHERTCCNKFGRFVYIIFKTFQASVWYYFIPFTSIFFSYQLPYFLGAYDDDHCPKVDSFSLIVDTYPPYTITDAPLTLEFPVAAISPTECTTMMQMVIAPTEAQKAITVNQELDTFTVSYSDLDIFTGASQYEKDIFLSFTA